MARQLTVETFPIEAVKELQLPQEVAGFEELPQLARQVLDHCPVVCDMTSEGEQLKLNFDGSSEVGQPWAAGPFYLEQVAPKHIRSMIIRGGAADRHWKDEHGNLYSCLTLKGNNFSHAQLIETATATDRYIGFGLQESAVIGRVIRASQMLRAAGIATEYIVGLAEPKQFFLRYNGLPMQEQPVSLADYKQYLGTKHWRALPPNERTFEALADIERRLERSTYYISLRATDTPYRFEDVLNIPEAREAVFKLINELHGETLSADSPEDWKTYVTKYFLPNAIRNIAKLHSLGLAHRYPNGMNLSALGALVDVDSVHGEPLGFGDDPINIEDVARDMVMLGEVKELSFKGMASDTMQDYASDIIRLYFGEVDKLYTPEEAIDIKLTLIPYLHDLFERANSQRTDYFINLANPELPALLIETVVDPSLMQGLTERWLAETGDLITKELKTRFMQGLPQLANWLLFDEILMDSRDSTQLPEGATAMIADKELRPKSAAYEYLFRSLLLEVLVPKYREYLEARLGELVYEQYRSGGRVDIIRDYLTEHLHRDFEDPAGIDVWLDEQLEQLIESEITTLEDLTQPADLPYVFTDCSYYKSLAVSAGGVVRETYGLGLPTILSYAKENDIEVIVGTDQDIDQMALFGSGLDYTVSSDAELIQVLSEIALDDSDAQYESSQDPLKLTTYQPHTSANDHVVYVEKTHTAKRRFVIVFKDKAKSQALSKLAGEELVEAIERGPFATALFDPVQYNISPF